jgi:hypothetical protein
VDAPRRFDLVRTEDVSGISGTGHVAEGVQWTDGSVSLRWHGDHSSLAYWHCLEDAMAIHGHNGLTNAVWID